MDHPAFPTSTSMMQQAQPQNALPSSSTSTTHSPLTKSPKSLTSTLVSGMIPSTPTTSTVQMNRTSSSSPRCRRPSPLRNNSICSDDVERASASTEEAENEMILGTSSGKSMGMEMEGKSGMGLGLISPSPTTKKSLILGLNTTSRQDRTPSRRDSGSEVEDVLFSSPFIGSGIRMEDHKGQEEMDGLDFGFSSRTHEPEAKDKQEEDGGKMLVDSKEDMTGSGLGSRVSEPGPTSTGRKSNKGINYNPSISTISNNSSSSGLTGKQHPTSSFIRPKPSFPRSAPLRPLTLTLSSSSGMNSNSSSSTSSLTLGGRYSTPHAGMMSSKSQASGIGGRKMEQGRQKVIVPKKGWKMSFDLGLTQSELARVA